MLDRIDYEIQRTIRSKKSLSILLADVDYFKKINDEHGHEAGDQVLEALGCLFLGNVRKQDSVARWGGEEFLFLLPDTNLEQAEQLAEKIRTTVANNHIAINDSSLQTSISFGVAGVENFNNVPAAINAADKRLYRAKEKGRDCVVSSD
jgi:diguanylate cyclase (GGDEF)-like protein